MELVTILNTALIIIGAIWQGWDRRRVFGVQQLKEPIVLELSISIDPTLQRQPIVTAYAKQTPVTKQ